MFSVFPDSMRALSSTKLRTRGGISGSSRVEGVEGPGIELRGREISVVSDLTSSSERSHSVCLPDVDVA